MCSEARTRKETNAVAISQEDVVGFVPRSLEDGEPIKLAMQELWLTGKLLPVGARLVVRHVFESAERKPVEVVYSFGLPRDAAMRKFRVESEGAVVHSELRPVKEAEEAYEEAMESGHLATLAMAYGGGIGFGVLCLRTRFCRHSSGAGGGRVWRDARRRVRKRRGG
jgi:hypothetical protein